MFFESYTRHRGRLIYTVTHNGPTASSFSGEKMPRAHNPSPEKTRRSAVLHFWNNGHRSAADIARLTKIPLSTVKYNLLKIKKQGTVEDRPRSGRPRKLTTNDNKSIGQWLRRNNEVTATEIAQKLHQKRGQSVSPSTVRRQLHRLGYRSTLPRGTPMLTEEHKRARVRWAIRHKDDDWTRTIFTDETGYQLFRNTIRRWSKTPSAEVKRVPRNRQKIMAWGAISLKGLVGYYSFREIMDGPYFVQILREHLIPNARRQFGRRWRLQMGNDPKHRSRVALNFMDEQVPEILEWPSNSPDVNPVENLWSIMKRRVEKRRPSNHDELDQYLHEEWQNVDISIVINLINSMRKRCLALIASRGERISY